MSDIRIELIPKYIKVIDCTNIYGAEWRSLIKPTCKIYPLLMNFDEHIIDWSILNCNPSDNSVLEKTRDRLTWLYVHYEANHICLFERNPDKISFIFTADINFDTGKAYIHNLDLFQKYKDKATRNDKSILFELINRSILGYDYNSIKIDRKEINKEIIEYFYHPKRLFKNWSIY